MDSTISLPLGNAFKARLPSNLFTCFTQVARKALFFRAGMNSAAGGARECSKKVLAFQNSLWLHMYVVAENQGYHCRAGLARRACGEDVRPVSGSFCEAGTHRVSTRETYCLVGIPFLQGGEEVKGDSNDG